MNALINLLLITQTYSRMSLEHPDRISPILQLRNLETVHHALHITTILGPGKNLKQ